jgi:hypothetical protein
MLVLEAGAIAAADAAPVPPPKRAKPPQWTRDVTEAFFDDARKHLVGERPTAETDTASEASSGDAPAPSGPRARLTWSRLIDGETLATEVKRIAAGLREPLQNPGKFKSGGHNQCRADFSWLAVIFAVIAEYDGDVRWQEDAPALRVSLARAGRNCKAATDQTFAEATDRKAELDDLIRGASIGGEDAELGSWSSLAERSLLMQRMERGFQDGITAKLSNQSTFQKSAGELRHEAEILAVLADVVVRDEYEYWDDETFMDHASALKQAAVELRQAIDAGSYEAARTAAGRAGQACSACHEGYRG